jgi:hypothetical protein
VSRGKRSYRGWTRAIVDIDISEPGDKAARDNITLPQRILRAVDAHARKRGERHWTQCENRPERDRFDRYAANYRHSTYRSAVRFAVIRVQFDEPSSTWSIPYNRPQGERK